MRLFRYNTGAGDVALLQIYADPNKVSISPNGSGTTLQTVTFINPSSIINATGDFIFNPNGTFTFAADTRYWLLVDATAGDYIWVNNGPAITPTGISGITFNGYQSSADNGGTYAADNTNFSSFQINATAAVPVPFEFKATGGLVMLGGAWLLHKHLQKKKT